MSRVESHVISTAEDLAGLRQQWLELLERSSANEPVLSPEWLLTWWDVFAPAQQRHMLSVSFTEGGRLVGLAPLSRRLARYRKLVPIRKLDLLGAGEDPAHECCSCYIGLIAQRGLESAIVDALVDTVSSSRFPPWDQLQIPEMNSQSPLPALLRGALSGAGFITRMRVVDETFYIPLPASFEQYIGGLSRKRRYFARRTMREFERWAGGGALLRTATSAAELDEGFSVLKQLHRERWKAVGGRGAFASPLFTAFHERVLALMMARGAAELVWLEARGRPIAALYQLIWNGKVFIYQAGRAVDVPQAIRPGIVLHLKAIERAITRGDREYDLLCGEARYKRQLAGLSRPLLELEVWRPTIAQRACRALDQAARLTRGVIVGAQALRKSA